MRVTWGVYSAYSDIAFNAAYATLVGGIAFPTGAWVKTGSMVSGGLDEAGAVFGTTSPTGSGDLLLYTATLHANQLGTVTFTANPAEWDLGDVTAFGISTEINISQVQYGVTYVTISSGGGFAPLSGGDGSAPLGGEAGGGLAAPLSAKDLAILNAPNPQPTRYPVSPTATALSIDPFDATAASGVIPDAAAPPPAVNLLPSAGTPSALLPVAATANMEAATAVPLSTEMEFDEDLAPSLPPGGVLTSTNSAAAVDEALFDIERDGELDATELGADLPADGLALSW